MRASRVLEMGMARGRLIARKYGHLWTLFRPWRRRTLLFSCETWLLNWLGLRWKLVSLPMKLCLVQLQASLHLDDLDQGATPVTHLLAYTQPYPYRKLLHTEVEPVSPTTPLSKSPPAPVAPPPSNAKASSTALEVATAQRVSRAASAVTQRRSAS